MTENSQSAGPGGFLPPSLPSPAASSTSTTRSISGLPHPRGQALRPGSLKEAKVRRYVQDRLLHISRRYVKKFAMTEPGDQVVGYKSMGELCRDVESLVNIIWLSGTPALQVPYFLNVASHFTEWMTSFPPSPTATFAVLRKLDHCFASLLSGTDIETKETLPGFDNGRRSAMSGTDMVRCRSLVELTRVLIVEVMSKEPADEEDEEDENDDHHGFTSATESQSDAEGGGFHGIWEEDEERFHMDVARVFENTLVQLGETLGEGQSVGDI